MDVRVIEEVCRSRDMLAIQQMITSWADSRFDGRTDKEALSKLVLEEIPELLEHKKKYGTAEIGTELADCFILLMDLATLWEVDLTRAIEQKMKINESRKFKVDERTGHRHHEECNPLADCLPLDSEGGHHD